MIDNGPLQRAAWAELHAARKLHDKAARDLHRHEQVDSPAYESWLHRTFPVMVTTLRELHEEVFRKSRRVEWVLELADVTGRSPRKLWREQKQSEASPDTAEDPSKQKASADDPDEKRAENKTAGGRGGWKARGQARARDPETPDFAPPPPPVASRETKEIYRRLVQRLHPDRGGEWTPARQRLWHDIQAAWTEGDTDWLARLEMETEDSAAVLGPTSPLGLLRRAIEELHAARRNTERTLRGYRSSLPWRFTRLTNRDRDTLYRRITENFEHDIDLLQQRLAYLNATIGAWESQRPQRRRVPRHASGWRDGPWDDDDS